MRPVVLVCAGLVFGIIAWPVAAQQPPDQQASAAQQTGPNQPASTTGQPMPEEAQPPAAPEAEPLPPPPPFPPMRRARPSHRWVDLGDRHARATHRRSKHSSQAAQPRHHKSNAHGASHARSKPMHFSPRTIRSCHRMSYSQIMRHGSCRALMKRDLAAAEHRHRHSAQHRAKGRRDAAARRHHRPAKRRRA